MPEAKKQSGINPLGMISGGLGVINQIGNTLGIGQKRQDERQIKQQQKLIDQQAAANAGAAQYSQELQMDMWNKTNYSAQVQHLKDAGLNPALLYGKGGGGGATTGSGGGMAVTGGQAANSAATQQANTAGIANAAQMAMMNAQMGLIKAQTENVNADTVSKGAEPALKAAQTASLTQGIENSKQQQMLTEVQTRLAKLNETITGATMEDVMDRVGYEAEKAAAEMDNAINEAYVSTATRDEKIKIFQQEAIAGVLTNALTQIKTKEGQSNIDVNKAKINQMAQQIAQGWAGLDISDRQVAIQKFKEEVTANYPNVMNTVGKLIDDGISTIFEVGGRFRRKFKAVEK